MTPRASLCPSKSRFSARRNRSCSPSLTLSSISARRTRPRRRSRPPSVACLHPLGLWPKVHPFRLRHLRRFYKLGFHHAAGRRATIQFDNPLVEGLRTGANPRQPLQLSKNGPAGDHLLLSDAVAFSEPVPQAPRATPPAPPRCATPPPGPRAPALRAPPRVRPPAAVPGPSCPLSARGWGPLPPRRAALALR